MSTTRTKRGATARFLALLASLTMIVFGFVALASPANAGGQEESGDKDHKIWICHADMEKGNGQKGLGNGEWKLGWNLIPIAKAAWDAGARDGHDQHPLDKIIEPKFDENGKELRPTDADCGEPPVVYFCPDDSDNPDKVLDGPFNKDEDFADCYTPGTIPGGEETFCVSGEDWVVAWDGASYGGETGVTKKEAEAAVEGNREDAFDAAYEDGLPEDAPSGSCEEGNVPGGNASFCVNSVNTPVSWAGQAYGPGTGFTPTTAATKVEQNRMQAYKDAGVAEGTSPNTCPPPPGCEELGNCPPPPTCEQLGNCPTTTETPETPLVVEAATVAAPAEVPAAAIPAPAVVNVPAKATLPAAVPAGEGSTGLPMWALAMIALGMVGAAAAGKQLLGARK